MSKLTSHAPEEGAASSAGSDSESIAVQIAALIAQLSSSDGGERLTARGELVTLGKPAVAPLLAVLADHKDQSRQWEAAKALSEIADPVAAPALVATLKNRRFVIRWLAAEGLIALQGDALAPLLQALKMQGESVWLRKGAHHVLTSLSDPGLRTRVAPVVAALEDVEPSLEVPEVADEVLAQLTTAGR